MVSTTWCLSELKKRMTSLGMEMTKKIFHSLVSGHITYSWYVCTYVRACIHEREGHG